MHEPPQTMAAILARVEAARPPGGAPVRLVAASKQQPASSVKMLAEAGCRSFGENYVQEGRGKIAALAGLGLEWHLIGPLQSNKCRDAALAFDWIQTVDRPKLVAPLDRARPEGLAPLQVLVEVNIDDEGSKSGCAPEHAGELCELIAGMPHLRLRGLMAIPAPHPDPGRRRVAFQRMHQLYRQLGSRFPGLDTLSMGMSDDFELAIAEGSTMVRLGTLLFGSRNPSASLRSAPG